MIWYAVRTTTQREVKSEARLRGHGYETYLPRTKRPRTGQNDDSIPLFPGYFFLNTRRASLTARERGWDILQVIEQPVPEYAMDELRAREDDGGLIALPKTHRFDPLMPGVGVEVVGYGTAGFFGHRGLCQGQTADERIAVLFEILGRPQVLEFDRADVRALAYS